jgi:hypothetical protein
MEIGKEYPRDDEDYLIRRLSGRLRANMERDYPDGRMLRNAHPKQLACVQAEFTVEPDLPPELAIGFFAKPKTYSAWIRFSNAAPGVRPDSKRDIRGMGIQLLDVEGPPAMEDSKEPLTQDFLFLSAPTFITRDVIQFNNLVKAANSNIFSKLLYVFSPWPSRIALILRIINTSAPCASLLETRFWSTTPIAFGDGAVKYSATPRTPQYTTTGHETHPDFLRKRLANDLEAKEAVFDFNVQFQTDAQRMPIEDPTVEWDESDSAFRKVATIRIPPQEFDTAERDDFGDNLSINPWHCLASHRPLGGVNRGRKEFYTVLSKFRKRRNGVTT